MGVRIHHTLTTVVSIPDWKRCIRKPNDGCKDSSHLNNCSKYTRLEEMYDGCKDSSNLNNCSKYTRLEEMYKKTQMMGVRIHHTSTTAVSLCLLS